MNCKLWRGWQFSSNVHWCPSTVQEAASWNVLATNHTVHVQWKSCQSLFYFENSSDALIVNIHDTDEIGFLGEPISLSTLSSHCKGPWRWISIQHGVLVTSCLWYSAPHPLTKLILMVHILVSSYTASNPRWTDWERSCANSWLLNIFKEQFDGILQTVVGWKPWWWLQFRLCTNIALSLRHSAYTSPPK